MSDTPDIHQKFELNKYLPMGANLHAVLTLTFVQGGMLDIFIGKERYRLREYAWSSNGTQYTFTASAKWPAKRLIHGKWVSTIKRSFEAEFADKAPSMVMHGDGVGGHAFLLHTFARGHCKGKNVCLAIYPESVLPTPPREVTGWDGINPIIDGINNSWEFDPPGKRLVEGGFQPARAPGTATAIQPLLHAQGTPPLRVGDRVHKGQVLGYA